MQFNQRPQLLATPRAHGHLLQPKRRVLHLCVARLAVRVPGLRERRHRTRRLLVQLRQMLGHFEL